MDHDDVVKLLETDVDYLARKYWLSVAQVRRVIELTDSGSFEEIEEALALARKLRYERG